MPGGGNATLPALTGARWLAAFVVFLDRRATATYDVSA